MGGHKLRLCSMGDLIGGILNSSTELGDATSPIYLVSVVCTTLVVLHLADLICSTPHS